MWNSWIYSHLFVTLVLVRTHAVLRRRNEKNLFLNASNAHLPNRAKNKKGVDRIIQCQEEVALASCSPHALGGQAAAPCGQPPPCQLQTKHTFEWATLGWAAAIGIPLFTQRRRTWRRSRGRSSKPRPPGSTHPTMCWTRNLCWWMSCLAFAVLEPWEVTVTDWSPWGTRLYFGSHTLQRSQH